MTERRRFIVTVGGVMAAAAAAAAEPLDDAAGLEPLHLLIGEAE
jgi:hypothetical protein